MRILDKDNKEIENPNLEKGYLKLETIVKKHHEAVEASAGVVKEWKVIKEYDNSGKDVVPIYEVEPVEAKPAWDETEQIQRYIEYTAEELAAMEKAKEEAENAPTPADNEQAITELSDVVAENSATTADNESALVELSSMIESLQERIAKLEGEKTNG